MAAQSVSPVLLDMAISLDGFVGRADSTDPGLYDWYFDPPAQSKVVIDELVETTGAIVLGRGAFGTAEDAEGWDDSPYQVKHFVITHRPPAKTTGPIEFVFVPDGVQRAIELARAAAEERYVTVGGGADIARQLLAAGLVDELQLHVVPKLLGSGVRLFAGLDLDAAGVELTKIRVVDSPVVTHLRYRVGSTRQG
ncbi:MAG: dihydrofolate reductase family protein [Nakamurella sp.]